MSKIIEKLVVSSTAPNNPNVGWVKQKTDRSKELLIHDNNSWTPIGGSNSGGGSGSGIAIVDSVDKLDHNAELGSIAAVITPGSIQETSFRDLYQPDASMLDQNTGTLTQPELLSSVSSVVVTAPTDVNNLGFEIVESAFAFVTRDFSMENQNIVMISIEPSYGVEAMTMTGGYDTMQHFMLVEFSQDTMSYTVNNDQVEAFNASLANGTDWCYMGVLEGQALTEEQFNTIDLFLKAVAGVPSVANIYVKEDKWKQLYKSDLDKLASDLETTIESKANKISIDTYSSWKGLQPNTYTTYSISSTGSVDIKLAAIKDTTIYNEYILELNCASAPSSVVFKNAEGTEFPIVWANGNIPTFEAGMTYLISIANGFGVYSMFPNS